MAKDLRIFFDVLSGPGLPIQLHGSVSVPTHKWVSARSLNLTFDLLPGVVTSYCTCRFGGISEVYNCKYNDKGYHLRSTVRVKQSPPRPMSTTQQCNSKQTGRGFSSTTHRQSPFLITSYSASSISSTCTCSPNASQNASSISARVEPSTTTFSGAGSVE
jgi:hypothetical protein